MNDDLAIGDDGVAIWHTQAVALADAALALAEQAAKLASECAIVASSAHQRIEAIRVLIEAHQPVVAR